MVNYKFELRCQIRMAYNKVLAIFVDLVLKWCMPIRRNA